MITYLSSAPEIMFSSFIRAIQSIELPLKYNGNTNQAFSKYIYY